MKIIKRDGSIVDYNPEKIRIAIKKANKEVSRKEKATDAEIDEIITYIEDLKKSRILVEDIQDIIEQKLMSLEKKKIEKIISLSPGVTDILIDLNEAHKIIAADTFSKDILEKNNINVFFIVIKFYVVI